MLVFDGHTPIILDEEKEEVSSSDEAGAETDKTLTGDETSSPVISTSVTGKLINWLIDCSVYVLIDKLSN